MGRGEHEERLEDNLLERAPCEMEPLPREELLSPRATHIAAESPVRYLEAWMEGHLAEPIGIDDLAAAVSLSPRSVQYAFRRHRDCTPMQALLARRLDRARQELVRAESSVTEAATLSGFFHLKRFARRYRERFREVPSVTLARARQRMLMMSAAS